MPPHEAVDTEVVPIKPRLLPTRAELQTIVDIANAWARAAGSRPEIGVMKILAGIEIGMTAGVALHEIDWIEGKTALSARSKVGMVRKLDLGDVELVEMTDTVATVKAWKYIRTIGPDGTVGRTKGPVHTFSYTIEQAEKAGLLKSAQGKTKSNWHNWRSQMLHARVESLTVGALWQELFMGLPYSPEELGADTDELGRPLLMDAPPSAVGGYKPTIPDITLGEVEKAAAEEPASKPTPTPPTAAIDSDSEAQTIKNRIVLVINHLLKLPKPAIDAMRARWKPSDRPMTVDELKRMYNYVASLNAIEYFRKSLSLSADQLNKALQKRGATALHELPEEAAHEFAEKLAEKCSPFNLAELRKQFDSASMPAAGINGLPQPPCFKAAGAPQGN